MSKMLENLGEVRNAIHRGDHENALVLLIGLKRSDEIQREVIQTQIDSIKKGKADTVSAWVEKFIDQHSDVNEAEEISIGIDILSTDFQISESVFGSLDIIEGDLRISEFSDLSETSYSKKDKLKAKLATLRANSEIEVLSDKVVDEKITDMGLEKSKLMEEDPFIGLMEISDNDSFGGIIESYGQASKSSTTTKDSDVGRTRNNTPIAPVAVDEFAGFGDLGIDDSESSVQYRGEPRLSMQTHSSDSGEEKKGDAAISFILEEPQQPTTNLGAIRLEAIRLLEAGELDTAYDITKKILSRNEDDETSTLQYSILGKIEKRNLNIIGDLSQTPNLLISLGDLSNYALDHRAGFLASMIDGMSTYEDLIDISGMPREKALELIAILVNQKVIS